jgi:hypothetical protein
MPLTELGAVWAAERYDDRLGKSMIQTNYQFSLKS